MIDSAKRIEADNVGEKARHKNVIVIRDLVIFKAIIPNPQVSGDEHEENSSRDGFFINGYDVDFTDSKNYDKTKKSNLIEEIFH